MRRAACLTVVGAALLTLGGQVPALGDTSCYGLNGRPYQPWVGREYQGQGGSTLRFWYAGNFLAAEYHLTAGGQVPGLPMWAIAIYAMDEIDLGMDQWRGWETGDASFNSCVELGAFEGDQIWLTFEGGVFGDTTSQTTTCTSTGFRSTTRTRTAGLNFSAKLTDFGIDGGLGTERELRFDESFECRETQSQVFNSYHLLRLREEGPWLAPWRYVPPATDVRTYDFPYSAGIGCVRPQVAACVVVSATGCSALQATQGGSVCVPAGTIPGPGFECFLFEHCITVQATDDVLGPTPVWACQDLDQDHLCGERGDGEMNREQASLLEFCEGAHTYGCYQPSYALFLFPGRGSAAGTVPAPPMGIIRVQTLAYRG